MTKPSRIQFILSVIAGNIAAYFLTSFFKNFYPLVFEFVLLSFLFQLLGGISVFFLFGEIKYTLQTNNHYDGLAIVALFVAFSLSVLAVIISWQFPELFDRSILFMDVSALLLFLFVSMFSLL